MVKYAVIISYDGKDFHGSQLQPNLRTVQGEIEKALKNQFQMPIKTSFASRTDKGVHAIAQVFHFFLPFVSQENLIKIGLNKRLPLDIRIHKVIIVNDRFHSRHDVLEKTYKYTILKTEDNVFNFETGTYFYDINYKKFIKALSFFKGKHNFGSFTKNDDDKETIKEIKKIKVNNYKNKIDIFITARSFLKYMIRIIIGTCYLYSKGIVTENDIKQGFLTIDRKKFNFTAPAKGLTLYKVLYKEFLAK